MHRAAIFSIIALMWLAADLAAQSEPVDSVDATGLASVVRTEPVLSVTQHSLTLNGATIHYTATAGTMPLLNEDGSARANVFFVAYTRDEVLDVGKRPITFTFNGGPGSSSVWLHLGAFGPKRVLMSDRGDPIGPPYRLIENEGSLLDLTDLVFIDPVTTGFSRAAEGEDPGQFHGVEEDVESVGEFIRLYTTRFERWSSPKFLVGESYGTTRAAGLAGHLQERHGIFLNGVILVSSILNFQTARFNPGNDLPYILFLPTYTATAWYHGQLDDDLSQDLQSTLAEVEAFALGDYTLALMQGANLPEPQRRGIAERLARYTGLSVDFIEQSDLRLRSNRFAKELLRGKRRTVGRLDSRFKGIDADAAGESYDYDPSYAAIQGPYTALLNDYVRRDLGFESDLTYEILTGRVRPWNYGEQAENQYLNVADTLRSAMTKNQSLRVFIASGRYDCATPYFATDYTFSHLGLDPDLMDHVTTRYYESGHMMYIHKPSLIRLKEDLSVFYREAVP